MTQPRPHTRDFSKKRAPVYFTIDGRRYDCFKALDLGQLSRFADLARNIGDVAKTLSTDDETSEIDGATAAISKIAALMKIVMKKMSYVTFMTYLQPTDDEREKDDFEPVDYVQLLDIVKWLMEVYTGRPTQPSSNSSTGSEFADGGTSSTAGASLEELDRLALDRATS